jgi:uncharacterized protein (TIGR02246 family)
VHRRTFLATSLAVTATSSAAAEPSTVRATVDALLAAQRDAWNRGDLDAFCAPYSDDAVFMSPSGVTRGRADVLARYTKKYGKQKETMGTLSFDAIDVQVGVDVVTMAMRWQLSWPTQKLASGHTLIVWRKIDGVFRLVQDASM